MSIILSRKSIRFDFPEVALNVGVQEHHPGGAEEVLGLRVEERSDDARSLRVVPGPGEEEGVATKLDIGEIRWCCWGCRTAS
jgi:hypothetical protein